MNDNETRTMIQAARAILAAEARGETPPTYPGLERKIPNKVAAIDANAAWNRNPSGTFGGDTATSTTADGFSICRAVKATLSNDWSGAEFERGMVRRTLDTNTDSLGGFLVPEDVRSDLIGLLRPSAVLRRAGATVIDTTGTMVRIPRLDSGTSVSWVGMDALGAAVTSVDPTFGMLNLELRRAAARVVVDIDLLRSSTPAAEDIVKQDMAQGLGLAEDLKLLCGAGGAEPLGLLNYTGFTTTDVAIAAVSTATLIGLMTDLRKENANPTGWIMHPQTWSRLLTLTTGIAEHYLVRDFHAGINEKLLGLPVYLTTQLPTTGDLEYVILGDWRDFVIAQGAGLEIHVLKETYMPQLAVGIVGVHRCDGAPRHVKAFKALKIDVS